MQERIYNIRISPEVINNKFLQVIWSGDGYSINVAQNPCCDEEIPPITGVTTGNTFVYVPMPDLLSGGTNGNSLLDITVPIFLSENTVDVGYYNVFDGFLLQKDTMLNFLFSATTLDPKGVYFYNTSDVEFKKYLDFSNYFIDWGDGTFGPLTSSLSSHTYSFSGSQTITLTGVSPWGTNKIRKTVNIPFTGVTIDNPRGTATFTPAGGNWSATSFSYDYIFSGDANCNSTVDDIRLFNSWSSIPFLITGYTQSSLRDLKQYGLIPYKPGESVTGNTGAIGIYSGISLDGLYTAYTINDIDYYDYSDGTTLFAVYSSGLTSDMVVCQPIVKNELLLGIIDEPEVQSNIFVERGKNSALERIERLGEVDNIGDLEKYGYKFFEIINTI